MVVFYNHRRHGLQARAFACVRGTAVEGSTAGSSSLIGESSISLLACLSLGPLPLSQNDSLNNSRCCGKHAPCHRSSGHSSNDCCLLISVSHIVCRCACLLVFSDSHCAFQVSKILGDDKGNQLLQRILNIPNTCVDPELVTLACAFQATRKTLIQAEKVQRKKDHLQLRATSDDK
jgi:hypothetical protein